MARRHLGIRVKDATAQRELLEGFRRIRRELDLPGDFTAEVQAEAEQAAARSVPGPRDDLTGVPFFTIDPPGSTDLDQAMHIERRSGGGFRVRYAIADVGAFVTPGGAIDQEAHRRGETYYSPDGRVPLHPPVLSDGAASLLPDQVRPAVLWTIDLASDGEQTAVDVRRALVRSRDRLDYAGVQQQLDAGRADERLQLLGEVGRLRKEIETQRGGVSLPIPEQQVEQVDSRFRLSYRVPVVVESWNEQISLLTGMAAADLMLHGEVGILRTLPAADQQTIDVLRRSAQALGIRWSPNALYAHVIATLEPDNAKHAAFLEEATTLLRGAGYTAFDGGVPEQATHAAVAAAYAHATAPLRRLVDRYVSEVCLALCGGTDVPDWVRAALPGLPAEMAEADRRASTLERECVALMEAVVLRDAVGQVFDAVVVERDADGSGGTVQLADPAVRAAYDGELPLGEQVRVRLAEADVERRSVRFRPA